MNSAKGLLGLSLAAVLWVGKHAISDRCRTYSVFCVLRRVQGVYTDCAQELISLMFRDLLVVSRELGNMFYRGYTDYIPFFPTNR